VLGGFRLRPGLCEADTTADKRDTPAPALSCHDPGDFAARDDGGLRVEIAAPFEKAVDGMLCGVIPIGTTTEAL